MSIITATHRRSETFKTICLPSVLSQRYKEFEWIIVNDGRDLATRTIVKSIDTEISIQYIETSHRGLCASRNLGLERATGDLVGFLDDDNYIHESYVEAMVRHFNHNTAIAMGMPIQNRRRDIYKNGRLVMRGRDFASPKPSITNQDLIMANALFDSNGFIHQRNDRLRFNENLLVLSDYEYLLRCFSEFGLGSFSLCPQNLVEYVQTNEGIIGQASFKDWLRESEYIWAHRSHYNIFSVVRPSSWMPEKIVDLRLKVYDNERLHEFSA
nr:glycosyltransferase family 2 protein [Oculatella sp. LEGE 06141]